MRHLYIHIPFCASKCDYCAFASVAEAPPADFVARLLREFHACIPLLRRGGAIVPGWSSSDLATIYVGGGTPSVLSPEQLRQLRGFIVSGSGSAGLLTGTMNDAGRETGAPDMDDAGQETGAPGMDDAGRETGAPGTNDAGRETGAPGGPVEFTVEVNPGSLTRAKAEALRDCGANRISVGAQSFDPAVLAFLGRGHTVGEIHAAVAMLRSVGFANIGLDLIAAIPGVSRDAFLRSLEDAIALGTQHLSVYALSIEGGTPFARRNLRLPSDDEQLDQLAAAEERLTAAGFIRYEISNYAKPGYECAHNLAVWRGEDYLGIGPSAASRLGRVRCTNPCAGQETGAPGTPGTPGLLTEAEDARERFLTGLRLAEGVLPPATPQGDRWKAALERLIPCGIVRTLPRGRYALTSRGREVADAAMGEVGAEEG